MVNIYILGKKAFVSKTTFYLNSTNVATTKLKLHERKSCKLIYSKILIKVSVNHIYTKHKLKTNFGQGESILNWKDVLILEYWKKCIETLIA